MAMITLRTFDTSIEAHLLKSKLESEGITCFIFDENINSLNPLLSMATGGIKLKVSEADFERATSITVETEETNFTDDNNQILTCPSCGSDKLYGSFKSLKGTNGVISGLLAFWFMVFPLYFKTVYRCKDCGHEFRNDTTKP